MLSGNRNFEGRIQQQVRANYLASPPLVVAYALAGRMTIDLTTEPLGTDTTGTPVYLRDIWPTEREIQETMLRVGDVGDVPRAVRRRLQRRRALADAAGADGERFAWDADSTYIRNPPFFEGITLRADAARPTSRGARVLALLGDSITTDHISPAGSIKKDSPAGKYLIAHGVQPTDFNSYGARRGNHEVMMRGTFANIRLRNQLAPGTEGGWTTLSAGRRGDDDLRRGDEVQATRACRCSSSPARNTAPDRRATGRRRARCCSACKAVIAESFERIHRSNLVNMGVLPLQFQDGAERRVAEADRPGALRRRSASRDGLKPGGDGHRPRDRRRRHDRSSSRRSRASTRRRSSSRSGTAASCRTCCGSSSGRISSHDRRCDRD